MTDLKDILKKALPEKKLERTMSDSLDIDVLLSGEFCDDQRTILRISNNTGLNQLEQISEFPTEIPAVLRQYCKLTDRNETSLIYFDTETTGLSGGTGTLAFLCGMAWIEEDAVVTEQYFLADPSGEKLFLELIREKLNRFNTIVTYNGKSFDLPLMRTRYIMNGIDYDPSEIDHIDLLHISRRFWSRMLSNCTLQNLEITLGDFCVVIGPGPIGLAQAALIKASGAGTLVVVGTRDYRLEIAKKNGADYVFNTKDSKSKYYCADVVKEIDKLTGGKMADRVLVSTSTPAAMELPFKISGRRSNIVFFGLPGDKDVVKVPVLETILWDKRINFSWLAPLTYPKALNAIASGLVDVDSLVTHKFPLKDLKGALEKVKNREGNPVKALVIP